MNSNQPLAEVFLPSEDGLFHRLLNRLRLNKKEGKVAILALCVTWLPLVIITAIEGTLNSGTHKPFLQDTGMQARLLIALPLLILIKVSIDEKVREVNAYFLHMLMSPEERKRIVANDLRIARKVANSPVTEIILLLIVFMSTILLVNRGAYAGLQPGIESWMTSAKDGVPTLTLAGRWAVFFSLPIFQFLLFRWLWRYFIWIFLLFRLSKAKLLLLPTHADRSGGLGVILLAQRGFNILFTSIGVVMSGALMAQLVANPETFHSVRNIIIAYIVLCLGFLLVPMLFFVGRLVKTKNEGLVNLSNLGTTLSKEFEKDWIKEAPIKEILANQDVDPSMLFDYQGVFDSVQQLRIAPVTVRDIVTMAILLFIPFIPILFIRFSVAELLQKIVGILV